MNWRCADEGISTTTALLGVFGRSLGILHSLTDVSKPHRPSPPADLPQRAVRAPLLKMNSSWLASHHSIYRFLDSQTPTTDLRTHRGFRGLKDCGDFGS